MSDLPMIHTGVYWRTDPTIRPSNPGINQTDRPVLLVSPDGRGWQEFKPAIWSPPAQIGRAVTDPVREVLWESKWTGPALQAAMRPMQGFDLSEYGERAYRALPRRHRELLSEFAAPPVDRRQIEMSLDLYGRDLVRNGRVRSPDAVDANALAFVNLLDIPSHREWRKELMRLMFIDDAPAPLPPRTNVRLTNICKGSRADYAIIDDPLCPPDRWYSGGAGDLVSPTFFGMDAHRSFYELPAAPPVETRKVAPRREVLEPTTVPLVDPSLRVALRNCAQRAEQGEPHVPEMSGSVHVRRDRSVLEPFVEAL